MRQRDAFLELLSPNLVRSRRSRLAPRVVPEKRPVPSAELAVARIFVAPPR